MLVIKDIYDLKKYLETRKKMAENYGVRNKEGVVVSDHARGVIFGFDESIKAVQALIDKQHSEKKE